MNEGLHPPRFLSLWALLSALALSIASSPRAHAQPAAATQAPASASAPAPASASAPEVEPPPAGQPPAVGAAPDGPEPSPAPLLTDPPQPGETAASYVQRSVQYFGSKEYENAALALEKAYKIDPKPLFLFNTTRLRNTPTISSPCDEVRRPRRPDPLLFGEHLHRVMGSPRDHREAGRCEAVLPLPAPDSLGKAQSL
ncbi:MAG: hypothetical protein U1A78_19690 [Polyangia bacterium]